MPVEGVGLRDSADLATYRRKRDFKATPEPKGKARPKRGGHSYVIQKHDASRLHYDFRLEHDAVLLSWAVPKGPSLNPRERRLAVRTEDHPIEYGKFEGVIPEGQYGGGSVMLWDRGSWSPHGDVAEGLRRGKLSFDLEGERLRGGWKLVRMASKDGEGENWLLMKVADDESGRLDITKEFTESVASGRGMDEITARPERAWKSSKPKGSSRAALKERVARAAATPKRRRAKAKGAGDPSSVEGSVRGALPEAFELQLATLVSEAPEGSDWIHEIKFDGYRIAARLESGKARLVSRNDKDWTTRFKPLAGAVAELPAKSALLDGEVVAMRDDGATSFQGLQRAIESGEGLRYVVFDLLHLDGWDLRGAALEDRKLLLERLLDGGPAALSFSAHVEGHGREVHRQACDRALEGVISKRRDLPYSGGRSRSWVKTKCIREQEVVIGGFTDPQGAREGLGALLVGVREGGKLRYAGKVGTGFDDRTLASLTRKLSALERKTAPFANPPKGVAARGAHWVEPRLVAQVQFLEWTAAGLMRHPSFEGLREDKEASEVVREEPARASASARPRAKPARGANSAGDTTVAGISISSADRVVLEDGVTKLDVARHYEAVAERMLEHVADRPIALLRCPGGASGKCFFQKHRKAGMSEAIETLTIVDSSGPSDCMTVDSVEGLVGLAQYGVIELHAWGSHADRIEQPDQMVFDLDPDPAVGWDEIVAAARDVRARLEALDLRSFVKTTGGKGLHLVVPMRRGPEWPAVRAFTEAVARALAAEAPGRFVANMSKAKRKGKIFVDYLRNGRGATAVAPYSVRARGAGTVATPIDWDELGKRDLREDFTIATMPQRLRRPDPWSDFHSTKQSLGAKLLRAVARLRRA